MPKIATKVRKPHSEVATARGAAEARAADGQAIIIALRLEVRCRRVQGLQRPNGAPLVVRVVANAVGDTRPTVGYLAVLRAGDDGPEVAGRRW